MNITKVAYSKLTVNLPLKIFVLYKNKIILGKVSNRSRYHNKYVNNTVLAGGEFTGNILKIISLRWRSSELS